MNSDWNDREGYDVISLPGGLDLRLEVRVQVPKSTCIRETFLAQGIYDVDK